MTAIAPKPEMPALGFTQEDWDEVSDNPELTDEQLAELRPASEMPPEIFALLPKRGRGRPKVESPKVNLTLRLDPGLIEAYKASGPGWQTRMHRALAAAMPLAQQVEPDADRPGKRHVKRTVVKSLAASVLSRESSSGKFAGALRSQGGKPGKRTA